MASLVLVLVLFGGTFLVWIVDRKLADRHVAFAGDGPDVMTMLLLTVFVNVAALPVYFYQTRRKKSALLIGFAAFAGLFTVAVAAAAVVQLLA